MSGHLKRIALILVLAFGVIVPTRAQNDEARIDRRYSIASLNLASSTSGTSWNIAIAKVSGTVGVHGDAGKDAFNFVIYPAQEGSRVLNSSGGLRENSLADLARYTLMSFRSTRVCQNGNGTLAVTGQLSITHVQHELNIVWDNEYSDAGYGKPVARTTTREVTFVFGAPRQATVAMHKGGPDERSALATVSLHDFPGLRSAWLDSVWPVVVEDEHCEMPGVRANFRDYRGAICTGNPILTATPNGSPQGFGEDYPGPGEATAPATNQATILIHLRLEQSK